MSSSHPQQAQFFSAINQLFKHQISLTKNTRNKLPNTSVQFQLNFEKQKTGFPSNLTLYKTNKKKTKKMKQELGAQTHSKSGVEIWVQAFATKARFVAALGKLTISVLGCEMRRFTSNSRASFIHRYSHILLASLTLICSNLVHIFIVKNVFHHTPQSLFFILKSSKIVKSFLFLTKSNTPFYFILFHFSYFILHLLNTLLFIYLTHCS